MTGSVSVDNKRRRAGAAAVTRRSPRIRAALRTRPWRLARARAVPFKERAKSRGSASSQAIRSGAVRSGLGSRAGSRGAGALWFQGQTSWQTSQPKAQPSSWAADSGGRGPDHGLGHGATSETFQVSIILDWPEFRHRGSGLVDGRLSGVVAHTRG